MKPIYYIKAAVMSAAVLAAASCTYDPYDTDIDPTVETMTLKCENPMVEIDENNLNAPALTFTWKAAPAICPRSMCYLQGRTRRARQTARLKDSNHLGRGFDYTYDNATGLYSATFTNEQLNNWYKDRWAPRQQEFHTGIPCDGTMERRL